MNCTVAGELFEFREDDIGVAVLPLFHVFGLSSVLNVTVRYADTMVLVPRFEILPVVDAIEKHRCTIFSGVPTMYFAMLNTDLSGRDLSSLRVGVSGGAAIPGETIRAFEEEFPGCVILEGYGLSESASTTTSTSTPSSARCSRSASRSGASRSASSTMTTSRCPPARGTSASSSSAATTS